MWEFVDANINVILIYEYRISDRKIKVCDNMLRAILVHFCACAYIGKKNEIK